MIIVQRNEIPSGCRRVMGPTEASERGLCNATNLNTNEEPQCCSPHQFKFQMADPSLVPLADFTFAAIARKRWLAIRKEANAYFILINGYWAYSFTLYAEHELSHSITRNPNASWQLQSFSLPSRFWHGVEVLKGQAR